MRTLTTVLAAALVLLPTTPAWAAGQSPVAVDDAVTYQNSGGVDYPIDALANDTDPDGDPLTYTAVTPAAKGNAYLKAGTLYYKPYIWETGTDSFTYTVSDSSGNTATATVTATLWVRPDQPGNPAISSSGTNSVTLTWSATTNAAQYRVYRNGVLVQTTPGLTWTDTGLLDTTVYSYRIAGVNGGGGEGFPSTEVIRWQQLRTPTHLAVDPPADDPTAMTVSWGLGGLTGSWNVYRDGVLIATTTEPRFAEAGLVTGREYGYQVQLLDTPYPFSIHPPSLLSDTVIGTPGRPSAIGRLVRELGGDNGVLGPVTVPERAIPGGRQQEHLYGIAVQQDGGDAYAVVSGFENAYAAAGATTGDLGFPLANQDCGLRDAGCSQFFEGGSIWRSRFGYYLVVRTVIEEGWAATGWEEGPLGYPIGDEMTLPGGIGQAFEDGRVYWSATTGSHGVSGETHDAYAAQGGTWGVLGYPTSDEFCGLRDSGCFQPFQGGSIYWSPASGAHAVSGGIGWTWAAQGWESGRLGYPTSDAFCGLRDSGCFQPFQGGSIYWSPASGAAVVLGAIRDAWAREGWEAGRLGYPVRSEVPVRTTLRRQEFQGGSIVFDMLTGQAKVSYNL